MELAQLLKSARNSLQLTLETVSGRTGIAVSAISEFENGHREPRLAQLNRLAKVYHRSVTSFLDGRCESAPSVLWRQRPDSPFAEELQSVLIDLATQYRSLEVLCDLHTVIELPTAASGDSAFSYPQAASLARRVRNDLGLGDRPGQTLLRVLEEVCNVKVFHLDFEPSGSAACALSDEFGAAVLLNARNSRWRRNFDLAHELFHLVTWRLFGHDRGEPASAEEEKLATCFARNLLMPEEVLREAVEVAKCGRDKLGFDGLFEVAREFDVSVEAVVWQMGFVYNTPAERTQRYAESVRNQPAGRETRSSDTPPRRPTRFESLARQALRNGLISTGRFSEYTGMSRRDAMKLVEQDAVDDVQIEVAHT